MKKWMYFLLIVVIAGIIVYFVIAYLFPGVVKEFTALVIGAIAAVTGLFLRRRK